MKSSFQKIFNFCVFGFLVLVFLFSQESSVKAAVVCTNISPDVYYGMTDQNSSGPVTSLQKFLFAEGYLSATPNGHFGPATLSAVTSFQSSHSISSTGYVGALTRAAIVSTSCGANTAPNSSAPATTTVSSSIVSPLSGVTLSLGQTYKIAWNSSNNSGYSIVLEDQNGLSQGFVTPNAQLSGSFTWQVGTVLSGVTSSYATVPTGTYRLHFYAFSGGSDLYSGNFTIVAPPLTASLIIPTNVSLVNSPTMVVYGSGFNSATRVNIDGAYNFSPNILYASPDGTVVVFPLPTNLSVGQHTAYMSTAYGTVISPPFTLTQ